MIITSISGFFPLQPSGKTKIKHCQEHTLTLSTVTTCFTLTPFRVMVGKIVLKQVSFLGMLSFLFPKKDRRTDRQTNSPWKWCVYFMTSHIYQSHFYPFVWVVRGCWLQKLDIMFQISFTTGHYCVTDKTTSRIPQDLLLYLRWALRVVHYMIIGAYCPTTIDYLKRQKLL